MDNDNIKQSEPYEQILSQTASLDDILIKIAQNLGIADHEFTHEEIEEARGNLSPKNDRVAAVTFADNKNNHIITGIADNLKKIYDEPPIPPIERTFLQELSLPDVLGRGMIADMISEGWRINVATEIQKGSQADFAVRGTLSSSNIMRRQFGMGDDYSEAPNTIGIYILGFNLPEFAYKKEFITRIVRSDYDTGKHLLAEKYSDFYVELDKVKNWNKSDLDEKYHELWDLCLILNTKIKDMERVIKINAVQSPLALDLARETRTAVAPTEFMNDTMRREKGLAEIQAFLNRNKKTGETTGMEKMIITAIQSNVQPEAIETMKNVAGITDVRLAELKKQAQAT